MKRGWLIRGLVRMYPQKFRDGFAREIEATFAEKWAEERGKGIAAGVKLWMRTVADVMKTAALERRGEWERKRKSGKTILEEKWRAQVGLPGGRRRGDSPMRQLWSDVKYGVRMLRKSAGATAVAILTLALGIGASTTMFAAVYAVLLRPLPFPEPERIVAIWQTVPSKGNRTMHIAPPNIREWQEHARSFEAIAGRASGTFIVTGDVPERVIGDVVTPEFFAAMGVQPVLGRGFLPEEARDGAEGVVVLGNGLWKRKYGGDEKVIGQAIQLNAKSYRVVGVMPAGFDFPEESEAWVPLIFEAAEMTQWQSHYVESVARLKKGVSLAQAQAEMNSIARQLGEEHKVPNAELGIRVLPLHEEITGKVEKALWVLAGAVGFVLLIACGNVASVQLARSAARQREIGIRAAMGAGRGRLVRQLLTESVLLGLAGGALGVVLARWGIDLLRVGAPEDVPRLAGMGLSGWVLGFAVVASVMTGILFGVAPAMGVTRASLREALGEGARSSAGGAQGRLRSVLIVAEMALSLVLLAGAGLMLKSLWRLVTTNPGFEAAGVLTAEVALPRAKYPTRESQGQFAKRVLEELKGKPGVELASVTTNLPLSRTNMVYGLFIEGKGTDQGDMKFANFRAVTEDYLKTLHVPLLRGRWFDERDKAGAAFVVLVNQRMAAKYWPNEDAVGKRIQITRGRTPQWREIVGVVGDIRHAGLHEPPTAEMYVPFEQDATWFMRFAVRTAGDPLAAADAVRHAVWAVDKDQPVTAVRPLEAVVAQSVAEPRFQGMLLAFFAAVALVLAAVGVYGVMAYSVEKRKREMGIRMALGAQRGDVLRMVVGQGARIAVIGATIGLAGAFGLTRLLTKMLYGVKPTDPVTFAAVTLVLVGAALAACWVPARRATRVEPVEALRYE